MDIQWTDWEKNVLKTFLDGGIIRQLPAKQKKRKVILKWLAHRIPLKTKLSHADFNQLLQQYHLDSATLRRELFVFGYVDRDRDFYWRDATSPEGDVYVER